MITRPIWCCGRLRRHSGAAGTPGVNNANVNRGRVNTLRMHEFAHVCIRPAFRTGGKFVNGVVNTAKWMKAERRVCDPGQESDY